MTTRYELQEMDGTVLSHHKSENTIGRSINKQRSKGNDRELKIVQYHNESVRDEMIVPEGMTVTRA